MKYSVITFGCRVNLADSLRIEDLLRRRGGVESPPEVADVVVVNSCSVTASAEQGTRQAVRRVARINPGVKVVVTGCYASRGAGEVSALPNVVRVVGNGEKDDLESWLEQFADSGRFADGDGPCGASLRPGVAGRTALTLRVQTGCDEPCSYCIIPTTRGRGRSRALLLVIEDVRRAIAAGYKEIAITGVHLGSYGRDLGEGQSLLELLRALASTPENVLFRISSLEPMDCTNDIVDLVTDSPRLAPHFHLPLQHGSNRVLRAMRRPYTAEQYAETAHRIHRQMPWASLGSDLIAGFPGETDEDAAETERVLADLPLSYLHVFPYSDRPGTEASGMGDKVDGARIRDRARSWRVAGERLADRFRASQAGSVRRALSVDDGRSAVTDNFIKVRLPNAVPRNEWLSVVVPPTSSEPAVMERAISSAAPSAAQQTSQSRLRR